MDIATKLPCLVHVGAANNLADQRAESATGKSGYFHILAGSTGGRALASMPLTRRQLGSGAAVTQAIRELWAKSEVRQEY